MPFTHAFDWAITFEAAIAGAVMLIILGVFGFGIIRYRASRSGDASQDTEHPRVEIAYAVLLLLVALTIVLVTRHATTEEAQAGAVPKVTVHVTGFQWCWRFQYVNPAQLVTSDCQHGRRPTLVVPAGQPVLITTTSTDVIHSLWVPAFRFKLDAFPGHVNSFVMTAPHPGVWAGHCAEFCGDRHAFMLFTLKAVTPAQFAAWRAAQPIITGAAT